MGADRGLPGAGAIDNVIAIKLTRRLWRPVTAWERGARDEQSTIAAWIALATLPLEYLRRVRAYPFVFSYLPFIAFVVWKLNLQWYSFFILAPVGTVVLALEPDPPLLHDRGGHATRARGDRARAAQRLHHRGPGTSVALAPARGGAGDQRDHRRGRSRALDARASTTTLRDLGLAWLIAVAVSFTISLEMVVLVVRSLGSSLSDLRSATERVRAGDYSARVPVVATDETGKLAQSFNTMVEGLEERERLREAFGAYVDPALAERVLREGSDLEGEEVEVSVLFLDIRNFTAFAEQARPHEVVSMLNGFWELVVPVLLRHGGHANKFIGDGLLGVFGAPERVR